MESTTINPHNLSQHKTLKKRKQTPKLYMYLPTCSSTKHQKRNRKPRGESSNLLSPPASSEGSMAIPWLEERHLAMWEVLGGEFPGVAKDTHISQGRKIKSFYMYIYIYVYIHIYIHIYINIYIYILGSLSHKTFNINSSSSHPTLNWRESTQNVLWFVYKPHWLGWWPSRTTGN